MFSLKYLIGLGGIAVAGGTSATAISLSYGKPQLNKKMTEELKEVKKDENTNSSLPSIDSEFSVFSKTPNTFLNSKLFSITL